MPRTTWTTRDRPGQRGDDVDRRGRPSCSSRVRRVSPVATGLPMRLRASKGVPARMGSTATGVGRTAVLLRVMAWAGDLLRVAVLVAAVVCAVLSQWDDTARFVVVSGVLLMARWAGLPRPFDAALGATLLVTTVAMAAGWYASIVWIDLVIHCV